MSAQCFLDAGPAAVVLASSGTALIQHSVLTLYLLVKYIIQIQLNRSFPLYIATMTTGAYI